MGKLIKVDENMILMILLDGLGYSSAELPVVGSVVRMPAREAFVYSVITSHGYLDNKEPDNLYRLTRDAFRIFNQACRYEFQEGIFSLSDMRLASTVNNEALRRPYIAKGDKFILPVRYTIYNEFQLFLKQISKKLISRGFNPNDFIICPIRNSRSATVELESFFEFVVSRYFGEKGFLTDTQIPFFYGIGTPDMAAYVMPEFMRILRQHGYLNMGGSLIDLMTVSVFGRHGGKIFESLGNETVVCEVKTSQIGAPQIIKYTDTQIFNKAYEVIPCTKEPESYAGLITVDSDGHLIILECKEPIPFAKEKQRIYLRWIEHYAKFYLLTNLYTSELEDMLMKNGLGLNRNNLLKLIKQTSVQKLITQIDFFLTRRRVKENVQD